MPKLILMFKDKILNTYPIIEGGTLTIGRHPDSNIVIDNLAVSGHHARIDHRGGEIELFDLGSRNGILRNGQHVTQCILNNKDIITIGKHLLHADWTDTMAVEQSNAPQAGAAAPLDTSRTMILEAPRAGKEDAAAAPNGPRIVTDCLLFLSGGQGEYVLSKQVSIGKNTDADIVVSGVWALLMGGPAAVIMKQAGNYFLSYTGGLIRPKRNGASVKGTVRLKHEDIVAVGPIKVRVQLGERLAA